MYCKNCGMQYNPGETMCRQCGAQLENNIQQPNPMVQPPQPVNSFNNQAVITPSVQTNSNVQNTSGVYKLTLTRPKNFVGSLVKFKIYIDNNEVGAIKNGETIVLDVNAGSHTISFNKTIQQNINMYSDTYADVVVLGGNRFGISNVRDANGSIQNNQVATDNIENIVKSAKKPLIASCACIGITFLLLFTMQMVISPWVYGVSIGYTIISISSIKKNKELLNEKYSSLMRLNIISIVVSVIGMLISGFLMI